MPAPTVEQALKAMKRQKGNTFFEILGVTESSTDEVILAATNRLKSQYNPKNPPSGMTRDMAEAISQIITQAHEVLTDRQPEGMREYYLSTLRTLNQSNGASYNVLSEEITQADLHLKKIENYFEKMKELAQKIQKSPTPANFAKFDILHQAYLNEQRELTYLVYRLNDAFTHINYLVNKFYKYTPGGAELEDSIQSIWQRYQVSNERANNLLVPLRKSVEGKVREEFFESLTKYVEEANKANELADKMYKLISQAQVLLSQMELVPSNSFKYRRMDKERNILLGRAEVLANELKTFGQQRGSSLMQQVEQYLAPEEKELYSEEINRLQKQYKDNVAYYDKMKDRWANSREYNLYLKVDGLLQKAMSTYEKAAGKAFFVKPNEQRLKSIKELRTLSKRIAENREMSAKDKEMALVGCLKWQHDRVVASHKQGGRLARWGITKSNLAKKYDSVLKHYSQEELQRCVKKFNEVRPSLMGGLLAAVEHGEIRAQTFGKKK